MPRGITEQDVFEAADALLARGERPTIERVRQEIGSGSPNTVNPLLDAWWVALGKRVGGAQASGLPPALLQAATRFHEELQKQALAEAGAEIGVHRLRAEETENRLATERAAHAAERALTQQTLDSLRTELAQVKEANQSLVHTGAKHLATAESARGQANEAAAQLQRAREEHDRAAAAARVELEKVREQWQGNEKHWLKEIEHLREEIKRQRGDHERGQKGLQARIQELELQLSESAKERASLRVAAEATHRELLGEREKRSFFEGALTASKQAGKPTTPLPRRKKT